MNGRYGEGPVSLDSIELPDWHEFMHYLYLPVRLPDSEVGAEEHAEITLPARLEFLRTACYAALDDARYTAPHLGDPYVYVTARRGFASPGNPLNRPGWHCDDFGGTDLNYIWSDVYPTRLLLCDEALPVPADDAESMRYMETLASDLRFASHDSHGIGIVESPVNELLRLTPWVIHNTPEVPAPGGMRSFFKISVSTHRYDLLGNSHNHLLDYDWPMVDRAALRNQPSGGNRDYSGATS